MTVMIVDDSAGMRRLLCDLVAPMSKDVVECADGQECVDRFAVSRPEWTIMDVQMPRLDGLGATREVRARWPEAKVLLVSHFMSPEMDAAAHEAGAIGCLSKDDLYQVAEVIARHAAAARHLVSATRSA